MSDKKTEKKNAVDYKGKHFVIIDESDIDEFDIEHPFVDLEETISNDKLLLMHVQACGHYGIPPYIGNDQELKDRIESLLSGNEKEI